MPEPVSEGGVPPALTWVRRSEYWLVVGSTCWAPASAGASSDAQTATINRPASLVFMS